MAALRQSKAKKAARAPTGRRAQSQAHLTEPKLEARKPEEFEFHIRGVPLPIKIAVPAELTDQFRADVLEPLKTFLTPLGLEQVSAAQGSWSGGRTYLSSAAIAASGSVLADADIASSVDESLSRLSASVGEEKRTMDALLEELRRPARR